MSLRPSFGPIVDAIRAICDGFESYGYRRVGAALRHKGLVVNGKKIRRLMASMNCSPDVGGAKDHGPGLLPRASLSP